MAPVDQIDRVRVVLILHKLPEQVKKRTGMALLTRYITRSVWKGLVLPTCVPIDFIGQIDLLLVLEDVLDEQIMQRLVGQIDAQLAEQVFAT